MARTDLHLAIVGRVVAVVVVALGFVIGVQSCTVTVPGRAEFAASLVDSGISKDTARCAADALYDNLSEAELRKIAERGNGGAPVDDTTRDDDPSDQVRNALSTCRTQLEATTTTTTLLPPIPDEGTTTVIPDDGGAGGSGASLEPADTITTTGP